MKLFIVRHGETDYNRQKRYQGRTNTNLNKTGLRQAQALRRRLLSERIDKIYTSSLMRAADTAHIIAAGRSIKIITHDSLAEIDFGQLEGLTYQEITDKYPGWQPTNFDFTAFGGESLEQLRLRMEYFVSELRDDNTEDFNILIVAHSGCLRVMLCFLLGRDTSDWWRLTLSPASLTIIDNIQLEPALKLLNDTSHLERSK